MKRSKYYFRAAVLLCCSAAVLPAAQKTNAAAQTETPSPGNKPATEAKQAQGDVRAERMAKFLAIGEAPDPAAVQRGKQIFTANCGFCHGATATGGEGGPNLVRSVLVLHDNNGSNIGPVVHQGRPGKGMPAFPAITDAQISDIAAYLKSRIQAAANRGAYEIQNIVVGNAESGKAYFDGTGKCNTCHSATGDLAGVAKKYEPDVLQSLILFPIPPGKSEEDLPEKARETATVTEPNGQKVSGFLMHMDDFNVAVQDASGNYHSWERQGNGDDGLKVEVRNPLQAHVDLVKTISDTDLHNVLAYLETLK